MRVVQLLQHIPLRLSQSAKVDPVLSFLGLGRVSCLLRGIISWLRDVLTISLLFFKFFLRISENHDASCFFQSFAVCPFLWCETVIFTIPCER